MENYDFFLYKPDFAKMKRPETFSDALIDLKSAPTDIMFENLDDDGCAQLIRLLQKGNSPCLGVGINSCDISIISLGQLGIFLNKNHTLKYLDLSSNRQLCRDKKAFSDFALAVGTSNALETLLLRDCNLEDAGAGFLSEGLSNRLPLRKLDLRDNNITSEGASLIILAMQENNQLLQMYLDGNDIELQHLNGVLASLRRNQQRLDTRMTHVGEECNLITDLDFFLGKVHVIGPTNGGKTSLVASLLGESYTPTTKKSSMTSTLTDACLTKKDISSRFFTKSSTSKFSYAATLAIRSAIREKKPTKTPIKSTRERPWETASVDSIDSMQSVQDWIKDRNTEPEEELTYEMLLQAEIDVALEAENVEICDYSGNRSELPFLDVMLKSGGVFVLVFNQANYLQNEAEVKANIISWLEAVDIGSEGEKQVIIVGTHAQTLSGVVKRRSKTNFDPGQIMRSEGAGKSSGIFLITEPVVTKPPSTPEQGKRRKETLRRSTRKTAVSRASRTYNNLMGSLRPNKFREKRLNKQLNAKKSSTKNSMYSSASAKRSSRYVRTRERMIQSKQQNITISKGVSDSITTIIRDKKFENISFIEAENSCFFSVDTRINIGINVLAKRLASLISVQKLKVNPVPLKWIYFLDLCKRFVAKESRGRFYMDVHTMKSLARESALMSNSKEVYEFINEFNSTGIFFYPGRRSTWQVVIFYMDKLFEEIGRLLSGVYNSNPHDFAPLGLDEDVNFFKQYRIASIELLNHVWGNRRAKLFTQLMLEHHQTAKVVLGPENSKQNYIFPILMINTVSKIDKAIEVGESASLLKEYEYCVFNFSVSKMGLPEGFLHRSVCYLLSLMEESHNISSEVYIGKTSAYLTESSGNRFYLAVAQSNSIRLYVQKKSVTANSTFQSVRSILNKFCSECPQVSYSIEFPILRRSYTNLRRNEAQHVMVDLEEARELALLPWFAKATTRIGRLGENNTKAGRLAKKKKAHDLDISQFVNF